MSKPEFEFFPVTDVEYTVCPGDDPKITERILAKDPETGVATRILRYAPGADSSPMGVQKHDFWEEVYIWRVRSRTSRSVRPSPPGCTPAARPVWSTGRGVPTRVW
jgi:hypothetical protein